MLMSSLVVMHRLTIEPYSQERIMEKEYQADDGNAEVTITASSAREAAEQYVADGDWGSDPYTAWVTVHVWAEEDESDSTSHKVEIPPVVPDCDHEDGHSFKDGPVRGHGGGIMMQSTCAHCGLIKDWTNWGQDPTDGEQGLEYCAYTREYHHEGEAR